jgi:hypothetical protein
VQLTLTDIKARIARLDRLVRGLAREVALQRDDPEDVLLFGERKQYLCAIQATMGARSRRVWCWPGW